MARILAFLLVRLLGLLRCLFLLQLAPLRPDLHLLFRFRLLLMASFLDLLRAGFLLLLRRFLGRRPPPLLLFRRLVALRIANVVVVGTIG